MKHFTTKNRHDEFAVLTSTKRSQAALMTLSVGEKTGHLQSTEHPRSDQWVLVLSGNGTASKHGQRIALSKGSLLLIQAGEGHVIRNVGHTKLVTLSIYAPCAYRSDGTPVSGP